jgi:predicted nucleic acid-binding protein
LHLILQQTIKKLIKENIRISPQLVEEILKQAKEK